MKKFAVHVVMRIDKEIDGRGLGVVLDCSGAGIQNADFDFFFYLLDLVVNYNPKWVNYACVYELPWLLKGLFNVAKAAVPEDQRRLIMFADRATISEMIAPESLPDFMGGLCTINYRRAPKGCRSLEQVARELDATDKEVSDIMKVYESQLKAVKQVEDEIRKDRERSKDSNNAHPRKKMIRKQSSLLSFWYFLKRQVSNEEFDGDALNEAAKAADASSAAAGDVSSVGKQLTGSGAVKPSSKTNRQVSIQE